MQTGIVIAPTSTSRLEEFFATELGVSAAAFSVKGIRIVSTPEREEPSWLGYRLPFLLLSRRGCTVVSVAEQFLSYALALLARPGLRLDWDHIRAMQERVLAENPGGRALAGHALYCDPDRFRPALVRPVLPLTPEEPEWEAFSRDFDGPIFVARAHDGEVAAWSAVKVKSEDVWEVTVTTNPAYRGRGLGKAVASAATGYILEQGRVPLYVHDVTNTPSGRVARSLGYLEFAVEAFCSVSETHPTGMW